MNFTKLIMLALTFVLSASHAFAMDEEKNDNNISAQTAKIGSQVWMTENLNVDRFRNGDPIPEAKTDEEWKKAGEEGTPAWCFYENNAENAKKYGRLYNWYAVNDKRGLAPAGFHIPTEEDLIALSVAVNNNSNALKTIGVGYGTGAGTNSSGLSVLLAGIRHNYGFFFGLGHGNFFWSSTEYNTPDSYIMGLGKDNSNFLFSHDSKEKGFSVRCLKDSGIVQFSNDKEILAQSVKIGSQVWMKDNLNVDKFRNGDLIPEAKTDEEWIKAGNEGTPAWCYYDNNPENGKKYGKLYNWYAVNDKRGLAPSGWHISTDTELEALLSEVRGNGNALKSIGQGKGKGAGTNTSGFSAFFAGCRLNNGSFISLGRDTSFWGYKEIVNPVDDVPNLNLKDLDGEIVYFGIEKEYGFSVRCVKD